jgi:isopentenyl-diphosphate Delta-isomerase
MTEEQLILVNEKDEVIGFENKLIVHQKGWLHRAFSIFIFNSQNEILLQKRNSEKYHSGGLWTNTCCGHPRPNENIENAAKRRLEEEMGFQCMLNKRFDFIYQAQVSSDLMEYEFDHVFFGFYNQHPIPNLDEVSDWKYVNWHILSEDIEMNPSNYTIWFKICVEKINQNQLLASNY